MARSELESERQGQPMIGLGPDKNIHPGPQLPMGSQKRYAGSPTHPNAHFSINSEGQSDIRGEGGFMKTKSPRCARESFSDTRVISIVQMMIQMMACVHYIVREPLANNKCCSNGILPNSVSISVIVECDENKTQCHPCKDWLGQLFLIPGLVWKRVSPFHRWMCSLSGSQQPFSCVLGHFRHGVNRMILVQAHCLPVRR